MKRNVLNGDLITQHATLKSKEYAVLGTRWGYLFLHDHFGHVLARTLFAHTHRYQQKRGLVYSTSASGLVSWITPSIDARRVSILTQSTMYHAHRCRIPYTHDHVYKITRITILRFKERYYTSHPFPWQPFIPGASMPHSVHISDAILNPKSTQ